LTGLIAFVAGTSSGWETAVRRVDEYRKFADDCRQLALRLRKPEHRHQLEQMATAWEMLALDRETQLAQEGKGSDCAA